MRLQFGEMERMIGCVGCGMRSLAKCKGGIVMRIVMAGVMQNQVEMAPILYQDNLMRMQQGSE